MAKIVCEICGTEYQDTASGCPICGWVHDGAVQTKENGMDLDDLDLLGGDLDINLNELKEELTSDSAPVQAEKPKTPADIRKNKMIFDFDAVNSGASAKTSAPVPMPEDEDEEEEEEEGGVNVFLVIFLVIVIVALLLTTGFILFRYYLPGRNAAQETTVPVAEAEIVEVEETTIPTIPCTSLALPNGIDVLKEEGQYWLLHLSKTPEDTTDVVVYASEDESVATVTEDGRVTAVGEGETNIVITCGAQKITCPVIVRFEDETQPEETEAAEAAAQEASEEETPAETVGDEEAEETTAPTEADTEEEETVPDNVVLKLKKTDIQLGRMGVYVDLALDCELKPEQVTWVTSNSNVALVRDGTVTAMGPGIATITAKYNGQEVTCIVRCKF